MILAAALSLFAAAGVSIAADDRFVIREHPPLSWRGRVLTFALTAVIGWVALSAYLDRPLTVVTLAIGVFGFGAATATDLRERVANGTLALAAAAMILIVRGVVAVVSGDAEPFINSLFGAVAGATAGGLLLGGGLLIAKLRGAPIDESTGETTEDYGFGDVLLWILGGAMLGPVLVLLAWMVSALANGLIALPVYLWQRIVRKAPSFSIHLPQLPGMSIGVLFVLLLPYLLGPSA